MVHFTITEQESVDFPMKEVQRISVSDYEQLANLPMLDGVLIIGDIKERDPTVPQWAKQDTKPSYTADEVGAVKDSNAMTLQEIDAIFNGVFE